MAIRSDHTIWNFDGISWSQLPGAAKQVTAGVYGTIYVIGTDNNVYHWNGTSWDHLTGSGFTSLAYGNGMNVWAVGTLVGTNTVYRFSEIAIRHARTVSGSAVCYNCYPSIYHNSHVKASWASHYVGGADTIKNNWDPNTNLNISSFADFFDPFLCLEDDPSCIPGTTEDVQCSQVGTLENGGGGNAPPTLTWETAVARVLATGHTCGGSGPNCATAWSYTVENHCNTLAPDLDPGGAQ